MLNLEYLLEEAKSNGMPIQKKRGILREYLQIIVLNSIYSHSLGKAMFFTGGTAMRFMYNMPRFSEDLDFNTPDLSFKNFKEILNNVHTGLQKEGFFPEILSEKRGKLYTAELCFREILKLYKITDARGFDMMIKIEVYKPAWGIQFETGVISQYGYNFSLVLLEKKSLFAEKLCALKNRNRGRDIYDTLFMLKKGFPVNKKILTANKIIGNLNEIVLNHLKSLSEEEIKFLADQVRPFLFKEDDYELVLKARQYAEHFLEQYSVCLGRI